MSESGSHISSAPLVKDTPPHLPEDSIFGKPALEISNKLNPVSSPVFEDEVPENINLSLYRTERIPGLFTLCHVNQISAKAQIIKALELAYSYLHQAKLRQSAKLTQTTLK